MDPDVAGEVPVARQEAGVVASPAAPIFGATAGKFAVVQDLGARADRDPAGGDGETHRPLKLRKWVLSGRRPCRAQISLPVW